MAKLFTDLFNPKTLLEFILPERITKVFINGIEDSQLFYGKQGNGKSSLAKFLGGENYFYFNASRNGNIDNLREGSDLNNFVFNTQITFDSVSNKKIVLLDELTNVSDAFYDALLGFMDTAKNTIFIATTNEVYKVPSNVMSRFGGGICFDPLDNEEEIYLKKRFTSKLTAIIKKLNIEYTDENVKLFVNNNFPDFRMMLKILQRFYNSKANFLDSNEINKSSYEFEDLYKLIIKGDLTKPELIYKTTMGSYSNRANYVVEDLNLRFINYIEMNNPKLCLGIPFFIKKLSHYTSILYTGKDPALHMMALIFSLMEMTNEINSKGK